MEVKNESAALLSNLEVLNLLREGRHHEQRKKNKGLQNLATISYETVKYLEETPCKEQTEDNVKEFLKAVEPFKLTKAEKLQLLNHRPSTLVEIQLIIEESEERLVEEDMERLLEVISKTLPGDDMETDENNEQVEDDDDDAEQ